MRELQLHSIAISILVVEDSHLDHQSWHWVQRCQRARIVLWLPYTRIASRPNYQHPFLDRLDHKGVPLAAVSLQSGLLRQTDPVINDPLRDARRSASDNGKLSSKLVT